MLWNNQCGHPAKDYVCTVVGPVESYDVFVVPNRFEDCIEFCLRYGNEDQEYRSSWNCEWIERRISHLNKFGETPQDKAEKIMFESMKKEIQLKGYWDLPWDLTPEVKELERSP